MKQFFALASLFAVLSVSAQEGPKRPEFSKERKEHKMERPMHQRGEKRQRPSIEQEMKRYDQYNLSATQKKEIKSLHESRRVESKKDFEKRQQDFAKLHDKYRKEADKNRQDFDKKMKKIMGEKEFAQYQQDREKSRSKKFEHGKHRSHKEFKDHQHGPKQKKQA